MSVEPERLIAELRDPDAFPVDADEVTVEQTHISVVFLVGDRVYKVKKPVDLGFVDYSTLDRRRRFCHEEVRLNRRLAPRVYRGVVPVVEDEAGGLRVDGVGEPVEWAVEMVRLPDERRLEAYVERGEVSAEQLRSIGSRIADFHADVTVEGDKRQYATFERVAENARDNFEESADQVGTTVHPEVFERLQERNDAMLARHRERIERRAERGPVCDTHGDLRLEHVYLFPEREPPEDLAVVDCIEFNEAFRYADPVSDVAFLAMDLYVRGRRDLAETVLDGYFETRDDEEGRRLVDFYVAYRAAVRGKVHGLKSDESEVPARQRREAVERSRPHWLQALVRLEQPRRRPCLILVAGLPGTGKSTVAGLLDEEYGFEVFDSDVVRKELAGIDPEADAGADWGEGLYTDAHTEKTYEACRERAAEQLFRGGRVCVDATFSDESRREAMLETARSHGVPFAVVECRLPKDVVRERLESREDDPSDADLEIYRHVRDSWDAFGESTGRFRRELVTTGSVDETHDRLESLLEREEFV